MATIGELVDMVDDWSTDALFRERDRLQRVVDILNAVLERREKGESEDSPEDGAEDSPEDGAEELIGRRHVESLIEASGPMTRTQVLRHYGDRLTGDQLDHMLDTFPFIVERTQRGEPEIRLCR